jgi:hypothetical protein
MKVGVHVTALFEVPNIEPPVRALVAVPDWCRVRILLADPVDEDSRGAP